jgi:hypothetical protein
MTTPEVGMGATRVYWSDQRPYTIVQVYSNRCIDVRQCSAIGVNDGQDYGQNWDITEVESNPLITVSLRKNGRWHQVGETMSSGSYFIVGERRMYHDWSF